MKFSLREQFISSDYRQQNRLVSETSDKTIVNLNLIEQQKY